MSPYAIARTNQNSANTTQPYTIVTCQSWKIELADSALELLASIDDCKNLFYFTGS